MARPITVVAQNPAITSGNSVTTSKVSAGAAPWDSAVVIFPPDPHLTARDVDGHDVLGHQRDEALDAVGGHHRHDVVRAVPERPLHRPQRASRLVLDGATG